MRIKRQLKGIQRMLEYMNNDQRSTYQAITELTEALANKVNGDGINAAMLRDIHSIASRIENSGEGRGNSKALFAQLYSNHRATRGLIEVLTTEVRGLLNSMAKERQATRKGFDDALDRIGDTDLGQLVTGLREVHFLTEHVASLRESMGLHFADWRKQVYAYTDATLRQIAPDPVARDQRSLRDIALELEQGLAKALQRIEIQGDHNGGRSNMHRAAFNEHDERMAQTHMAIFDAINARAKRIEELATHGASLHAEHIKRLGQLVERSQLNGVMYAEMREVMFKLRDWQEGHNARFEVLERAQIAHEAESEARHSSLIDILDGHAKAFDRRIATGHLDTKEALAQLNNDGLKFAVSTGTSFAKVLSALEPTELEEVPDDARPFGTREELLERLEEVRNLLGAHTSTHGDPSDRIHLAQQRLGSIANVHGLPKES